ncbi:hypothetical protein CYMTET_30123 [Cymbomonas tetramitiformis]|uniref:Protein kinase domain-containing protein n=1 Tax=Cymbomonas tetramitiformis TaxID=36881 RepID=A0AAE0FJK5_9CHLO|nr:hypothetical protein CYMTET_30123 [Cymbomonas tetramitiformis]
MTPSGPHCQAPPQTYSKPPQPRSRPHRAGRATARRSRPHHRPHPLLHSLSLFLTASFAAPPPPSPPPLGVIRVESVIGFSELQYYRFQSATFAQTFHEEFVAAMIAGTQVAGCSCTVTRITQGFTRLTSTTFLPWDYPTEAAAFAERVRREVRTIFTAAYWEEFGMPVTFQVGDALALGSDSIPPPPLAPPPAGVHVVRTQLRFPNLQLAAFDSPEFKARFANEFAFAMAAAAQVSRERVHVAEVWAGSTVVSSTAEFAWMDHAAAAEFSRQLETAPETVFTGATQLLDSNIAGGRGGLGGSIVNDESGLQVLVQVREAPQFIAGTPAVEDIRGSSFVLRLHLTSPAVVHYVLERASAAPSAILTYGLSSMHTLHLAAESTAVPWNETLATAATAFEASVATVCGINASAVQANLVPLRVNSDGEGDADDTYKAADTLVDGHSTLVAATARINLEAQSQAAAERVGVDMLQEGTASGALLRELHLEMGSGVVANATLAEWQVTRSALGKAVVAGAAAANEERDTDDQVSAAGGGNVTCRYAPEVVVVGNLESETSYRLFVVAVDAPGAAEVISSGTDGLMSDIAMVELRTADVTPPTFPPNGYPRLEAITAFSMVLVLALSEPGMVYYTMKTHPTSEHIRLGWMPSATITSVASVTKASESVRIVLAGLASETRYTVHILAEDIATPPNWQLEPIRLEAVTLDITPPVLELQGAATVIVLLGSVYEDLGATAHDTFDGDVTHLVQAASDVDTSAHGEYTVTFTCKDAAGNVAAPVTRDVIVVFAPPPSPYGPSQPSLPHHPPRSTPILPPTQCPSSPSIPQLPPPPPTPPVLLVVTLLVGADAELQLSQVVALAASFTLATGAPAATANSGGGGAESVFTLSSPEHRAQATSHLHGLDQWTSNTSQAFLFTIAALCAVPEDAVTVCHPPSTFHHPPPPPRTIPAAPATSSPSATDVVPAQIVLPGSAGVVVDYAIAQANETSARKVASTLKEASANGTLLYELQAAGLVAVTRDETETWTEVVANISLQVDALVLLPTDSKAALELINRTLQDGGEFVQALALQGITLYMAEVTLGSLQRPPPAPPSSPPPHPLVTPPTPPLQEMQVAAEAILTGEDSWEEAASDAGLAPSDLAAGLRLHAELEASGQIIIRELEAEYWVSAGVRLGPLVTWTAREKAAFVRAVARACGSALEEVVVRKAVPQVVVMITTSPTTAGSGNSGVGSLAAGPRHRRRTLQEEEEEEEGSRLPGTGEWVVEYRVQGASLGEARARSSALQGATSDGMLLREVQRQGLPEVTHLETLANPGGEAHVRAHLDFVLGAADAVTAVAALNRTLWLNVIATTWAPWSQPTPPAEGAHDSVIDGSSPAPPANIEDASSEAGGGSDEGYKLWAGFGGGAAGLMLSVVVGTLVVRQRQRTLLDRGVEAAAKEKAWELQGEGWSASAASLGARLQAQLDLLSPGEWRLEEVLSEPRHVGGDDRLTVCVVKAYSRLIKSAAFKVVSAGVGHRLNQKDQAALAREAATMQRVRSPQVCACLGSGLGVDRRLGWLVMELVGGQTLTELLELGGGRLPEDRAIRIAVNVLRGLHAVHSQSLVHRDVKPGNIMVQGDSEVLILPNHTSGFSHLLGFLALPAAESMCLSLDQSL